VRPNGCVKGGIAAEGHAQQLNGPQWREKRVLFSSVSVLLKYSFKTLCSRKGVEKNRFAVVKCYIKIIFSNC
jgi:hypothetical protein